LRSYKDSCTKSLTIANQSHERTKTIVTKLCVLCEQIKCFVVKHHVISVRVRPDSWDQDQFKGNWDAFYV